MSWLVILNILLTISTIGFAIFALIAPEKLSGRTEPSAYYRKMYAVRAIPFGIGLIAALLFYKEYVSLWLYVAAVMQLGDAATNFRRGMPVAVIMPLIAAVIFTVSGLLL